MTKPTRHIPSISFKTLCATIVMIVANAAWAQSGEDASYIAVIRGSDVHVRCGAAESYYPFARLNEGDLVNVTGEKFDWVRVATIGPGFRNTFGFIKHAKADTGRFRLAPDGRNGVTLGKTDVIAPNLDAKNSAKDSWKSIIRLEADQTLRMIKTTHTDKDTIHEVVLPESAQGWISRAYIERASDEQTAQWKQMLAQKPAEQSTPSSGRSPSSSIGPAQSPKHSPKTGSAKPIGNTPAQITPTPDQPDEDRSTSPTIPTEDEDELAEDATAPASPDKPDAKPKPAEPRLPAIEDLEAAYKVLQKEPIESAELGPLRELYVDLAERSSRDPRIVHRANARAEQLQIWADLQKKRGELDAIRARSQASGQETEAIRKALESSAEYVAVGRVAASTIYDGKRLPKLLRLQDASTGRTIAYLQPDDQYELVNLIGNLIGVVGQKNYEETLRLNIIAPQRIDILTPDQNQAAVDTGT